MAIVEESGGESLPPRLAIKLPRVPLTQILAISIFWLALNFHWAALGIIILPSQVFKMVGDPNEGEAMAFVLIPGAFVSLFANACRWRNPEPPRQCWPCALPGASHCARRRGDFGISTQRCRTDHP